MDWVKKQRKPRRQRIGYSKKIYDRHTFEQIAVTQLYNREFRLVMRGYRFAKNGHKGQFRRDNRRRYFDHCKGVALIIMLEFKIFYGLPITVGLMHDLQEETFILPWYEIEEFFGKDVYRGLRIITKERLKDYYWGILNVEPKDWWIIVVKLADRLYNMRDILHEPEAFRRKQLEETERVYPELLDVLGQKIPKRYAYVIDYASSELQYACNKTRKSLGLPKSNVFKTTRK